MNTHKPAERHTGRGFLLVFALLGAGASVGLVWRQQRVQFYRERVEAGNEVRRMATVVRDSNDAITIQDFAGRITAWNRGAQLRQAMRAWLAPLFPEWTFEETDCAEAAMGVVALRPPALVLMDFKLPRLNGIEATRQIKARAPDVRVVIVTVYEDVAYHADAEAAGADGYVCKRRMHTELVPLLRKLLPAPVAEKHSETNPEPLNVT